MGIPSQNPNQQQNYPYDDGVDRYDTGQPAPEKMDVRWLWDYDFLWLKFEANLRGGELRRNPKTENWDMNIPQNAQAFMNDKGIKDVMAILRANVNVISGSSIMEENRVLMWCERMQKDLADMLYINMKEYELEPAKFMAVISTFMLAYEANLRKSIGGKALVYAMQNERRMTTEVVNTASPSGILGRVFGRVGSR